MSGFGSQRVLLVAHGSADPRYPQAIKAIAAAVRDALPRRGLTGATLLVAYLDHCSPRLGEIAQPGDVVVPLLLSTGFHASTEIPTEAPGCQVTPTLGPDARLATALAERLSDAGFDNARGTDQGRIVLAAAGTSDPAGIDDVRSVAADLGRLLQRKVVPAFLSAASPRVAELLDGTAAIAAYLLAPGSFADRLQEYDVPVVSAVLADHPAVVDIVADRIADQRAAGGLG